jgi:hypothetical protein
VNEEALAHRGEAVAPNKKLYRLINGYPSTNKRQVIFYSCTVHYQICRDSLTNALSYMLLYLHDGFYMFG